MPIESILTIAGTVSAFLLIAGLVAGRMSPAWRIWPAPPVGALKSFLFWSFFRTLNVCVLFLASERFLMTLVGPMLTLRVALAAVAFLSGIAYVHALWLLGRKATYCQPSGLTTSGAYRWTRNPQYATAILAIGSLGLAAWSWDATLLAAVLVTVYVLMARSEEPWLEARYGRAYLDYKAEVPRFFNARHAASEIRALALQAIPARVHNRAKR